MPPRGSPWLVLVELGAIELEEGEVAPRGFLRTTVGGDTAHAVRSVGGAAMLYDARAGTSELLASLG